MATSCPRSVVANRIVSLDLPAVDISVEPGFTYVGGPSFRLYGVAHAEQHLFVVADEQHIIRQLVWVQFEGYLPDNQRSYRYTVTQTVPLAGVPFIYDASTADIDAATAERPDSDLAAARQHLQVHGYQVPATVYAQRFVYLIEPDKRNELMIIYAEARGDEPVASALERALASFSLQFPQRGL